MKLSVRAQGMLIIVLTLGVVTSAIYVVYAAHLNRQYFSELQVLLSFKDEKNIEWGQLQLEESTFAASSEIEKRARQELKMRQPRADEIVMIKQ
ncbi:MAG: cell division protein FtsL [Gammaproteobacteria bacterium]|nr:cell division protein FtsL [Gammaproteobacteria bacterium]